MELSGKTAFVSGGSKGIGFACAKRLATAGANVFLAASNEHRLRKAAATIDSDGSGCARYHTTDLRILDGCNAAVRACIETFGGCDIFIHSAGATRGGIFPEQPDEDMLDGFALKFHAGVRLARGLWPHLTRARGTAITIVGGFARTPAADFMVGGAVNAALANFSKALAEKGLQDDVNVNWIHPGLTTTERLEGIFADRAAQQRKSRDQIEADAVAAEGIRRLGKPEDIAEMVLFLCSPAGRHVHGTGIAIDGGGSKGYW
ncbi:MAG: SDR family oxidoreductase [Paracoccaceae bacterium]|nr:SDR family oxidoreductase [Paracoccaceae bacterium]MDE2911318.1 SDR family oxidoreductase [Paracoccaceae bacterium]